MNWQVYWQTTYTKVWKLCGTFDNFVSANEHIDYLMRHIPGSKQRKFKITGMLKSFNVCELDAFTT